MDSSPFDVIFCQMRQCFPKTIYASGNVPNRDKIVGWWADFKPR